MVWPGATTSRPFGAAARTIPSASVTVGTICPRALRSTAGAGARSVTVAYLLSESPPGQIPPAAIPRRAEPYGHVEQGQRARYLVRANRHLPPRRLALPHVAPVV